MAFLHPVRVYRTSEIRMRLGFAFRLEPSIKTTLERSERDNWHCRYQTFNRWTHAPIVYTNQHLIAGSCPPCLMPSISSVVVHRQVFSCHYFCCSLASLSCSSISLFILVRKNLKYVQLKLTWPPMDSISIRLQLL